jgi:hypothetical protein
MLIEDLVPPGGTYTFDTVYFGPPSAVSSGDGLECSGVFV